MELPQPQEQHRWLQQLIGEWTFESEATAGPGQPEMKSSGRESVRGLGDLWVLAEGEGDMPGGGRATMLMTLGFDPRTGRFVGTWIGSMMTHLWVYDGELDAARKKLTLHSQGPAMNNPGKLISYRDTITIQDDDHRTLTGEYQAADGSWTHMMTARYTRQR